MDARSIRRRLEDIGIEVHLTRNGKHGRASITRPIDEDGDAWMTWLTASVSMLPGARVTESHTEEFPRRKQLVVSDFCIGHDDCL